MFRSASVGSGLGSPGPWMPGEWGRGGCPPITTALDEPDKKRSGSNHQWGLLGRELISDHE